MPASRTLKWISAGYEAFLGIPVFGGFFIISLGWTPLAAALILHIITLVFCTQDRTSYPGSVLGILASVLGFIPVVGMLLHWATAAVLLISASLQHNY
ncbi:MAG: hypothetical protein ABF586_05800 [Sporolactobacillus sp.]